MPCGLKMKYKSRIAFVCFILLFSFLVTTILLLELMDDDLDDDVTPVRKTRYYDTKLGYLQGRIEDALGLRKVVENPDLSPKTLADLENQIRRGRQSDSEPADSNTSGNWTVFYDQAVERLLQRLEDDPAFNFSRQAFRRVVFKDFVLQYAKQRRQRAPRLSVFNNVPPRPDSSNYYRFFYGIKKFSLYDPEDPAIDGLLHDMATNKIVKVEMMTRGTELKLLMEFSNRHKAVFKPMRWSRDHETLPNHFYFNDFERHHAEIAAFHLDRTLGFYRVPPVTGRLVNMTKEIFLLTNKALRKTFYVSPIGNICFYGECTYYCDSRHSFCGNVDMIEGSLMVYLPTDIVLLAKWRSPYRRSYSKFRRARWESDENFCNDYVKTVSSYHNTKLLLDLVDTAVFDFLTGNMDRHHTEIWHEFGNYSFPLHMDNGRGFGKAKTDEYSIIAPLRQCCVIRESTFLKLVKLYIGPERLSVVLDESLKSDPVYPILTRGHLDALDRRVIAILRLVSVCVENNQVPNHVIINDHF